MCRVKTTDFEGTMKADIDVILKTSSDFEASSKEVTAIAGKLSKSMRRLHDDWDDAGRQKFYLFYREYEQQIENIAEVLLIIADELKAVADRYTEADE